jgi:Zn finger protein HypA/HybF involved in hydrogenase expression
MAKLLEINLTVNLTFLETEQLEKLKRRIDYLEHYIRTHGIDCSEEESIGKCLKCGSPLQIVKPGKYQCPKCD